MSQLRVIRAGELSGGTAQTPGMQRSAGPPGAAARQNSTEPVNLFN